MKQYIYCHKDNLKYKLNYISWSQSKAGTSHNVQVKPYRGKKYNPEKYVTIVIG